jgi:hypothetical protein
VDEPHTTTAGLPLHQFFSNKEEGGRGRRIKSRMMKMITTCVYVCAVSKIEEKEFQFELSEVCI